MLRWNRNPSIPAVNRMQPFNEVDNRLHVSFDPLKPIPFNQTSLNRTSSVDKSWIGKWRGFLLNGESKRPEFVVPGPQKGFHSDAEWINMENDNKNKERKGWMDGWMEVEAIRTISHSSDVYSGRIERRNWLDASIDAVVTRRWRIRIPSASGRTATALTKPSR